MAELQNDVPVFVRTTFRATVGDIDLEFNPVVRTPDGLSVTVSGEDDAFGYGKASVTESLHMNMRLASELEALPRPLKEVNWDRPASIDEYFRPLEARHEAAVRRVVGVTRWRLRAGRTDHEVTRGTGITEWSREGNDWQLVPKRRSMSGFAQFIPPIPVQEVEALLGVGASESTGHALLLEAITNEERNPRSSLVIGVAALEVGTKELIADLVPEAAWLVENMQLPPVRQLLRDYLPALPTKLTVEGVVVPPPNSVLKVVEDAVARRNKIAHASAGQVDRALLSRFLSVAGDLLYLFDYYRGHPWALTHIRDAELARALGVPPSGVRIVDWSRILD